MEQNLYRWDSSELRKHVHILNGTAAPHILLKNATYLHSYLHEWVVANIWIYEDRIVYAGDRLPVQLGECEVVDCEGSFLVPGYIEPHAHPYQLYNPHTLASYAAQTGTTTLINDNMLLFLQRNREQAFQLLEALSDAPATMYWWCRFDGQTELIDEREVFNTEEVMAWLQHEAVVQGGELTAWPRLLKGDDTMLHWVQETKRLNKKIEGHFPGASEMTLAKLKLLGADCDHEAMTGKEVLTRLMQGYTVSLRHSSIRPDLPVLFKEMHELGIRRYENFLLTTDGSHPFFYEKGMMDELIRIAIEQGVPVIDAYQMATFNTARYYNMEHVHGSIAAGRIANINILKSKDEPTPVSVLAKGKWVRYDNKNMNDQSVIEWAKYGFAPLQVDWNLDMSDLDFTGASGFELMNEVITKPYRRTNEEPGSEQALGHDECYFMMVSREGDWRVNAIVKGFAHSLSGFASSYSGTGDFIVIGKNKNDMLLAFERMKARGGGMVIAEQNEVLFEMSLPLNGSMSLKSVPSLIEEEKRFIELLGERGYGYNDPAFTLLFFTATHLPFIRVTPRGLYDVKNAKVLVAPTKRNPAERIVQHRK